MNAVDSWLAELSQSPECAVLRFDFDHHAALLFRLERSQLEQASFLDDRLLNTDSPQGRVPLHRVVQTALDLADLRPLNFIFHTGHVGSTLVSRLLGSVGGVLSLREPFPLRQMAVAMTDARQTGSRIDPVRLQRVFNATLNLLRRGFPETRWVIVKATSVVGRIAPELMAALPESRAIYLNVRPETYLATYLANTDSLRDLQPLAAERGERLRRFGLPEALLADVRSGGEQAALAWLAESMTAQRAANDLGERLLHVDFDALLADLPARMPSVLRHFDLPHDAQTLRGIVHSPALARYSRAPGIGFSPEQRAQRLAMATARQGDEIRRGMAWLDRAAALNAATALAGW